MHTLSGTEAVNGTQAKKIAIQEHKDRCVDEMTEKEKEEFIAAINAAIPEPVVPEGTAKSEQRTVQRRNA